MNFCRHRDEPKVPDSGASTDEENDDGDFTVYECPGLAPVSRLCVFFLLLLTTDLLAPKMPQAHRTQIKFFIIIFFRINLIFL